MKKVVQLAADGFVALFGTAFAMFLLPAALGGSVLPIVVGSIAGLALCSFTLAAATFSLDVLRGRYPSGRGSGDLFMRE